MIKLSAVRSSLHLSSAALVIANLIPLAGALFWHWELFEIVFLYWFESAIIGFFTVLKVAWIELAPEKTGKALSRKRVFIFLLQALIFFLPLAAFMTIHLILIYIFGLEANPALSFPSSPPSWVTVSYAALAYVAFWILAKVLPAMVLPALALMLSHGVSFWQNFVGKKEYMRYARAGEIAFMPYQRMFLMHGTVLGGLILMAAFGAPVLFVTVLILAKIFVDLRAHIREHLPKKIDLAARMMHIPY